MAVHHHMQHVRISDLSGFNPHRARGIALILVMWLLVLITILIGTFAVLARSENLEARNAFDSVRARAAAEAALHRAAFEMRNPDLETKWTADGRVYRFLLGDAEVALSIIDETGKIDINSASGEDLAQLLESQGVSPDEALSIADAIQDWRDGDNLPRPQGAEADDYEAAGYAYTPRDGPFSTVEELQQVLGVGYQLYNQIEPAITVFSGRATSNPAFAPREALLAMGLSEEEAVAFIEQREAQEGAARTPLELPDGTAVVAQGGGLTYSIVARATLPNGAFSDLRATIRLGTDFVGRPFRIVRWQEGEYR
jgi:general secretion pathway protein K